ncbi:hypothetical protein O9929_05240 [Vibrio lentus]|nr:hypothetical protein [Vibrio lentus]
MGFGYNRKALVDAGIDLNANILERTSVIMGATFVSQPHVQTTCFCRYHSVVEKALQAKLANDRFSLLPTSKNRSRPQPDQRRCST